MCPSNTNIPSVLFTPVYSSSHPPPPYLKFISPRPAVPQVTIPSLFDVAPAFGVPTLPRLPPVFNMSFQDAVMQWMAAKAMNLQVRRQQQLATATISSSNSR